MTFNALPYSHHVKTSMKKKIQLIHANIQKPLWLKGKACPLDMDHNKNYL